MSRFLYPIVLSIIIFFTNEVIAQQPVVSLQLFSGGYTSPVDIKNCGDSRLFIVQQNGYIYSCDSTGVKNPTPFLDIHTKISQSSERGLLGMAFHPDYLNNGYFFVYYTRFSDGYIRIARYSVDSMNANVADPNSEMILIEIPHPTYNNHNGGGIQFGPDSYLYAGTGDGGSFGDPDENAQNTKKYLGKLLRFDVDDGLPYTIPPDNPFVADTVNYYSEIWAYGLRNPWRYSFDKITGDLWIGDVGQNIWEEIDYTPASAGGGQNYGWDCYEGTHNYEPNNCTADDVITWPVYEYQHSSGSNGDCSITGGYVYRGAQFGNLYGKFISVDYCSGKFRATVQNANGTFTTTLIGDEVISQDEFAFSSFGEDRHGEMYVADVTHGNIYSLTDTACKPVAQILPDVNGIATLDTMVCTGSVLHVASGSGLTYQWQWNGDDIVGATSEIYMANEPGNYNLVVSNSENCQNTSPTVSVGLPTQPSIEGIDSFYCFNQAPDTLYGIPSGGFFSGNGMSGNVFYPGVAGIGITTVSYTYQNEFGCVAEQNATIDVEVCGGVGTVGNLENVILFPMPNNGSFSIAHDPALEITELSIFTLSGKLVKLIKTQPSKTNITAISLPYLESGMYMLKIQCKSGCTYRKLVIEK